MELKGINEVLSRLEALGVDIGQNKENSEDYARREVIFTGMSEEEFEQLSLI